MFTTLHTLFETEYTDLALAVDEIAERIRSLGARAPGSFSEFAKLAAVKEATVAFLARRSSRSRIARSKARSRARGFAWRQAALQWRTSSQLCSQRLRQLKERPQVAQIFSGRRELIRAFGPESALLAGSAGSGRPCGR